MPISNFIIKFFFQTIMELGGIEKLVELVRSPDNTLRLNAIWALKNLVYQAESDVKEAVMKVLTYQTMEK